MSFELIDNAYGKSAVRLTKVTRHADRHELREFSVAIQLKGDFKECYTSGDNTKVLPTDTMKNTVYALAAQNELISPEAFALLLTDYLLNHEQVPHCTSAEVQITADRWERIVTPKGSHPHAFVSGGREKRTCGVVRDRNGSTSVTSGFADLVVLKTTDSAFRDFIRDQYTALPDSNDRIFATTIKANWTYGSGGAADYDQVFEAARDAVIQVFAHHKSLSVQQTLQAMGEAALEAVPAMEQITLWLPNQHRIPFNLQPLGLENKNEIFVTTSEPFGNIGGTIKRN